MWKLGSVGGRGRYGEVTNFAKLYFLEGRMMISSIEIIFMVNISSIIIIIITIINNNNSNKLFDFTHSPHQPVLAAVAPCVPGDSENASCLHCGAREGIEIETLHGHT